MVTATFRFYSVLGSFIARAGRGRDLTLACARDATAKHMIEALGVPHSEVALLLIDGARASADCLLADGMRVEAYPAVPGLIRAPASAPAFAADAHLGGLARLLRMAGFDTLYSNSIDDPGLVAQAQRDGRTVLTRDRDLLKRRAVARGCYLHCLAPAQQLGELALRLELAPQAAPFTRCLMCNTPLAPVARSQVAAALPPRVAATRAAFTRCPGCARVYWEGSHHARMAALLAALGMPGV